MGTRKLQLAGALILVIGARAAAVSIGFDDVTAPTGFASTAALRAEYAPLGVTFSGPGALDGGAILDDSSNFGVAARSGANFLAFNRSPDAVMAAGGFPLDPETLTFAAPLSAVSIFASGGSEPTTFRMEAFTAAGAPVTSVTQSSAPADYVQLGITSVVQPIGRIVLTEVGGDGAFVYDDLSFTFIPEPAGASVCALAVACATRARRRRR